MTSMHEYSYWIALSHLPKWRVERINMLIVDILNNKNMQLYEFFELGPSGWQSDFHLNTKETEDMLKAKDSLSNYSFLAEGLLAQGFTMIPINSKEYSATLKSNLKLKYSPPLLYVKGNTHLLQEPSVAIVGSRKASDRALEFTDRVAKKCTQEMKVVVSGFAKGVDRQALDSSIKYHGLSIIVLPQGIMTFGSGIKKYYKQLVEGEVLVLSTFYPKAVWDVGLAMARNDYIYGLAEEIFVAESDSKGGTWSGVIKGLKKGRKIYVHQADKTEKNANNILIGKGAIAVDFEGNMISPDKIQTAQHVIAEESSAYTAEHDAEETLEEKIVRYLSNVREPKTARQIKDSLQLEETVRSLSGILKKMPEVVSSKCKKTLVFSLKGKRPLQSELFEV
jgi:predicted Rossmann fold nucleotide-binding protein DprA/Smf involved in DNA uptake